MPKAIATCAWGVYCACSWTWCIGMFLPVIMLERYGWAGFWTFFIPNVIGCAAMGYVVATRKRSQAMMKTHHAAGTWFSAATIGFHMLFAVLLADHLLEGRAGWLSDKAAVMGGIMLLGGFGLSMLGNRMWLVLASISYAISIGIGVALLGEPTALAESQPTQTLGQLAFLAPVIAFGFLLCPYLDLTFHRAIQESPSRHAFGVFGFFFAIMLGVTVLIWFRTGSFGQAALVHLLVQSTFTVGVHLREIRACPNIAPNAKLLRLLVAGAVLPACIALNLVIDDAINTNAYLRWLALYGLVFPLYAWLFIARPRPWDLSRSALAYFGMLVLLAAPLYELGFIHHTTMLLIAPLVFFAAAKAIGQQSPAD